MHEAVRTTGPATAPVESLAPPGNASLSAGGCRFAVPPAIRCVCCHSPDEESSSDAELVSVSSLSELCSSISWSESSLTAVRRDILPPRHCATEVATLVPPKNLRHTDTVRGGAAFGSFHNTNRKLARLEAAATHRKQIQQPDVTRSSAAGRRQERRRRANFENDQTMFLRAQQQPVMRRDAAENGIAR